LYCYLYLNIIIKLKNMSSEQTLQQEFKVSNSALLLGAGLAVASFIVLPAVATRLGIGPSLTGALRIALMKASSKVCTHSQSADHTVKEVCPTDADCH